MNDTLNPLQSNSSIPINSQNNNVQEKQALDHDLKLSINSTNDDLITVAPHSPPSSNIVKKDQKPSFTYDLEIFNLCKEYLSTKNHHGLSLISRQKGIPPFLRFKVWPILLKYHPFVLNPFIQPDNDIINDTGKELRDSGSNYSSSSESTTNTTTSDIEDQIRYKIKKDLHKYIQRLKLYSQSSQKSSHHSLNDIENEILSILETSILKFTIKWGKIIKYDQSLTWIALNLAEWFPPIPKTPWVLRGRDSLKRQYENDESESNSNSFIVDLLDDYSNYIDNIKDLKQYLEDLIYKDEKISSMSFHDMFERLVLVLLHCGEPHKSKNKDKSLDLKFNSENTKSNLFSKLPVTGGSIEDRVSFFIYCLRKLLPELSNHFNEEQILTKFGCLDDEWLIWWLKFCGTKVWSKYDRGRIWDYLLGWRLKNPKRSFSYYYEKLNYLNRNTLDKLGPDIFWSVSEEKDKNSNDNSEIKKNSSFKDLINDLNNAELDKENQFDQEALLTIPFCKVDPHVSLIFISLSLLKSKENILVELDQHEIRQFLSRLPSKSYKYKQKHNQKQNQTPNSTSASPMSLSPISDGEMKICKPINNIIISNDDQKDNKHKINFIDNIILESGELWRKWLYSEWMDDN
ncbi:unnamed protein product [Candida verbasci]|uniref:Oxidant-induced cell-cycle arrest protein 5 n=1 Tax=Candida verbasci TaxID=1227364 RepID=A0A9W4TU00_9ASCO|nr:unnamed protein product [Candida verbasci]